MKRKTSGLAEAEKRLQQCQADVEAAKRAQARIEIAKDLIAKRQGVRAARKALLDSEGRLKEARANYCSELSDFGWKMRTESKQLLKQCLEDPKLRNAMHGIIVSADDGTVWGFVKRYMRPFNDFGLGIDGKTPYALFASIISIDYETNNKDSLRETLEKALVKGGTLIAFPREYREYRKFIEEWQDGLKTAIAFFYHRGESIDAAIKSAKALIEDNEFLAEDNYGSSLTEYLFCLDNKQES
ncbi:hypothetical protein J6X13_00475 [Candidatus Saccharibacteria bacterium]|nr:hypothetical protein [Candidatus Saccharibacteria bacterium]